MTDADLEAENQRLRAALEPFAMVELPSEFPDFLFPTSSVYTFDPESPHRPQSNKPHLFWFNGFSIGALRRAKAVFEATGQ
jgi:hypothetical protein